MPILDCLSANKVENICPTQFCFDGKVEVLCGVVYELSCEACEECNAKYNGKIDRAQRKRLKEHQTESSPLGHHMGYTKSAQRGGH